MRKIYPLLSVLFFLIGCGNSNKTQKEKIPQKSKSIYEGVETQKEYDYDDIMSDGGLYYLKFSDELVNGNVYLHNKERKILLGSIKNGLRDGKWTTWNKNGKKKFEGSFLLGKEVGLHVNYWSSNNEKWFEIYYSDGVMDGIYRTFGLDGKLEEEGTYKNGNKVGVWKRYQFHYDTKETTIIKIDCDVEDCS